MKHYTCTTCGNQYEASPQPPEVCPICQDERQYVNWDGQQWTTTEELLNSHDNSIRQLEYHLYGISIEPAFAIGQRALLIQSQEGNILWDCLPMLDESTIGFIEKLGGLQAIALSHPHFYGAAVEWSEAFGGVPIYIHAEDRQWLMRNSSNINFWEGTMFPLWEGIQIINCRGHFSGSCVLHYPKGYEGRGAIFSSDTLHVTMDRKYVSFMQSYPNLIPLSEREVTHIYKVLRDVPFDRIYGGWFDRKIFSGAKEAFEKSVSRYIQAIRN